MVAYKSDCPSLNGRSQRSQHKPRTVDILSLTPGLPLMPAERTDKRTYNVCVIAEVGRCKYEN
jgi:hypothetical protein